MRRNRPPESVPPLAEGAAVARLAALGAEVTTEDGFPVARFGRSEVAVVRLAADRTRFSVSTPWAKGPVSVRSLPAAVRLAVGEGRHSLFDRGLPGLYLWATADLAADQDAVVVRAAGWYTIEPSGHVRSESADRELLRLVLGLQAGGPVGPLLDWLVVHNPSAGELDPGGDWVTAAAVAAGLLLIGSTSRVGRTVAIRQRTTAPAGKLQK